MYMLFSRRIWGLAGVDFKHGKETIGAHDTKIA